MNILIVTDLYPISDNDNIPYAIENFALAFKEFGQDVTIVRPNFLINTIIRRHKIYKQKEYIRNGIKIYNRNSILPFCFNNLKLDKKFDIIISHLPSGHIFASLLNKKLNIPHIAILHQSDYDVLNKGIYRFYFKHRLKKSLEKTLYKGARNWFLKESLRADFVLPSFVERGDIIQKKELNLKKIKIITISRLIKRKNINLVIEALSKVNFDFEYRIFGSGEEEKNLKKLIKKYKLENKIKLSGCIPHNKVKEELDKSDVFILPSVNESFGLSYIEALSRGLIVVGCKYTGIDGVIKNNINGYLINPNVKEIENILKKIKNENRQELIENSLNIIKNYEKEKVMENYIQILRRFTG